MAPLHDPPVRGVLIQIVRAVTLALWNRDVQALQPGELYDVAPSVGQVLITDGWAREITVARAVDSIGVDEEPRASVRPVAGS